MSPTRGLVRFLGAALVFSVAIGCSSPTSSTTTKPAPAVSTFMVTYNSNGATGGSVPVDSTTYTAGSSFTVLGNSGSLTNSAAFSQFGGWTGASGTAYYAVGQTLVGSTSDWTLYAAWGGAVTTLAGSGTSGSSDNPTGTSAQFKSPYGIATDGTYVYVADTGNNVIRQITISAPSAVVTIAGSGSSGSANGTGTAASFNAPRGVIVSGGILYVADTGNNMIRAIPVPAALNTGVVTTLAGSTSGGYFNGTGTGAGFIAPIGLAVDASGNLYVADTNDNAIRKIVIGTCVVTTIAGTSASGSTNGTGMAARFSSPFGVVYTGSTLFVADSNNHLIRQIQ